MQFTVSAPLILNFANPLFDQLRRDGLMMNYSPLTLINIIPAADSKSDIDNIKGIDQMYYSRVLSGRGLQFFERVFV